MSDKELTPAEKLAIFKEHYYATGNITKSYIAAGFSEKSANNNAHKYFKDHKDEILGFVHTKLAEHVPAAIGVVVTIMNNPEEKGGIRLKAAQDLLDRAGYKPSDRIEIRTEDMNELSTGDIKDQIKKLLNEVDPTLGKLADLKVINGGKR